MYGLCYREIIEGNDKMDIEKLQKGYDDLKDENERLRYHISLLLMMLPESKNYDFFHYSIAMNFSRVETAKVLKILMKINAKLKKRTLEDDLFTVQNAVVLFDTEVPIEQYGEQFIKCMYEIFDAQRNINPVAILKACKAQSLYPDVCDLLLKQIEAKK